MPVKIACPKCSKNYTLPDSALGKAVKCQACGTAFRTRAPGSAPASPGAANPAARPTNQAQQRPAQQRPAQPANPNQNEFGVDGGFQKQADIFGAPPQGSAGLQNVNENDPFGDAVDPIVLGPAGAASKPADNPYQSVMTNSAARGSSARKKAQRKKQGKASADVSAYGVTRAGMMCVFGAIGAITLAILMSLILTVAIRIITGGAPPSGEPGALETVAGIVGLLVVALFGIGSLAMIVGQIMCMFAPNGNERFNSIGSGALLFLAMTGGLIIAIVLGAALGMSGPGGPSREAALSAGIGSLVAMFICGVMTIAAMFLFVNFYRKVGQNIKSDSLVKVSNQATIAICVPLVMPFLGAGLGFILGMSGAGEETIGYVQGAFQIFNGLVFLVVAAVILRMVWTGISSLKS